MKRRTNSLRYYLSMGLQCIIGLVVIALFLSFYSYVEQMAIRQCDEKAAQGIRQAKAAIDNELTVAEASLQSFVGTVMEGGSSIPPREEIIYRRMESFLSSMPAYISGIAIGFEDCVFPGYTGKGGFIPLVRRADTLLTRYQLGEVCDLRSERPWYYETQGKGAHWCVPFYSDDDKPIVSYALPLYNRQGQYIGASIIDVSLQYLSTEVASVHPYHGATTDVVNQDLTYVLSADKHRILEDSVPNVVARQGLTFDERLREAVKSEQPGKLYMQQGTYRAPHNTYCYYQPLKHAGWTILMECPATEVTLALNSLRWRMGLTSLAIVLLIVVVALSFLNYKNS